ncbi:MAG TPA: HisA/HisF-related TIM barrel protein [Pyrinomonadaceae bacterium]|jgi:cyclase|nr:HisA/HisF-related TIM barrel protein [Pyrinomonadaceae bacterium]
MVRPRIIPVLLLSGGGRLVKSVRFRDHRYLGDPVNAARLFSEFGADEIVILDIDASKQGRSISLGVVSDITEEVRIPVTIGGGISSVEDVSAVIAAGAEKVVIGKAAWSDPYLIKEAAEKFGSSAVAVCIDVRRDKNDKPLVWVLNGSQPAGLSATEFAQMIEEHGAGELIVQSIDRDGTMSGFDIDLVREVSRAVKIPVVALGGAADTEDLVKVTREGYASAAAAGSLFVYQGTARGVLINYPERNELAAV